MSPRQREYFRQKLLNWREELLNEAQATLWNSCVTIAIAMSAMRSTAAAARRARRLSCAPAIICRKLMRKIDEALARIDTGEPIGLARLQARPIATLSIEAQERRELRERQANLNH